MIRRDRSRPRAVVAVIAAFGLLAAACGDDDTTSAETPAPPAETETTVGWRNTGQTANAR